MSFEPQALTGSCDATLPRTNSLEQTLRKRYHVLKDHADQEEVRIRVEEQRREMRAELETKTLEMRADLDRERLEMEAEFETKKRVLNADFNGENGEVEPVAPAVAAAAAAPAAAPEGVLALSQVLYTSRFFEASLSESCLGRLTNFLAINAQMVEKRVNNSATREPPFTISRIISSQTACNTWALLEISSSRFLCGCEQVLYSMTLRLSCRVLFRRPTLVCASRRKCSRCAKLSRRRSRSRKLCSEK